MRLRLLFLFAMSAGCVSDRGTGGSPPEASVTRPGVESRGAEIERRSSARQDTTAKVSERPAELTEGTVTGEVPAGLLSYMKKDLSQRLSAGTANITVAVAESVIWNDGSLGCPKPDQHYTQETIPGYRVVLELAGQRYSYHADNDGYFVPCDRQLMTPPPGTTPTR